MKTSFMQPQTKRKNETGKTRGIKAAIISSALLLPLASGCMESKDQGKAVPSILSITDSFLSAEEPKGAAEKTEMLAQGEVDCSKVERLGGVKAQIIFNEGISHSWISHERIEAGRKLFDALECSEDPHNAKILGIMIEKLGFRISYERYRYNIGEISAAASRPKLVGPFPPPTHETASEKKPVVSLETPENSEREEKRATMEEWNTAWLRRGIWGGDVPCGCISLSSPEPETPKMSAERKKKFKEMVVRNFAEERKRPANTLPELSLESRGQAFPNSPYSMMPVPEASAK